MNLISQLEQQYIKPLAVYDGRPYDGLDVPDDFRVLPAALWQSTSGEIKTKGLRVGVVFSGGPAPGGHDVLVGILEWLRPNDQLVGFIGGFGGLLQGQHFLVDRQDKAFLSGSAGFDYLGTDRTKITTDDQIDQVGAVLRDVDLDALIVVGGDDSNTNAAYLARAIKGKCQIIGVPKTIDGDLQWYPFLAVTFGFHSASQHYADLVQALNVDACATKKYIHLVKLMGRSASHVALEVANQVEPNGCLLAEEVQDLGWGLADVIEYFSQVMLTRVAAKKSYGVLVFPEGLAEVIPEMKAFLNGDSEPLSNYLGSLNCDLGFQQAIAEDAHGNKNLSLMPFRGNTKTMLVSTIKC